jgi:hypothetical protein
MMNRQKIGKHARGGGEAYYYYLTKVGLASLLGFVSQKNEKEFVKHLSITQRELLPGIFELWPIFERLEIDDIARRRLPTFSAIFHGEPLLSHVHHESNHRPILYGEHGQPMSSRVEADPYRCTSENDAQAFLNPFGIFRFEYYPGARENQERWVKAIQKDDTLLTIAIQACFNQAESNLKKANDALEFPSKEIRYFKDNERIEKLAKTINNLNSTNRTFRLHIEEIEKKLKPRSH